MSKVKMTAGGAMEKEAARGFIDAWHRAEKGETFRERHLAFESWDALARVLTGKRMAPAGTRSRAYARSPRRSAATTAMFTQMSRP
jgi:hypothetical protein